MKCLPKVQSLLVTLVTISPPPSLPFWHLLLLSFILAMTFPAPCLPVHMPGCWAGRTQSHLGCALMGASCPGLQITVEERLLGSSGKTAAFQVGEQRPREGTGLTQGHTAATPMPLLPKSSLCAIKWIQRLHISIQIQNPCSFSTSSSQLGNCHPVSQVTEILIHVGLLLDLSRLPPGWQVWSLSQTLCYLFCGFSRTLHLESYWVGVPCPREEESHVRAKLRGGDSQ